MEDDAVPVFSTLSLGSLALLVLLLVPLFSILFLLFLFFRQQSQSQEEVHCARCHSLVAVRGVLTPPQALLQPSLPDQGIFPRGSSPVVGQQQVPRVMVEPPPAETVNKNFHHSATFQRLGMQRAASNLLKEAEALSSGALSHPASPPDARGEQDGAKPLTLRPVGRQQNRLFKYQVITWA